MIGVLGRGDAAPVMPSGRSSNQSFRRAVGHDLSRITAFFAGPTAKSIGPWRLRSKKHPAPASSIRDMQCNSAGVSLWRRPHFMKRG